jgi:hypothetical protein
MRTPGFRRIASVLVVGAVLLGSMAPPASGQGTPTATKVRLTRTGRWQKPSPDPSGLAYHRFARRLLVVDSEVEETPRWEGANIWMTTLAGGTRRAWSLRRFTQEPTDIAFGDRRTLYISDDNADRIFRVRRGPDLRWGTRDDAVTSFRTEPFGSGDPEGLELARGSLWITDGVDTRVYRVRPGGNGRFDGVAPAGDDVVTSFLTNVPFPMAFRGARDPEDVAFNPADGFLYVVSRMDPTLFRFTLDGAPVDAIDLEASAPGLDTPAGVTLAPGSSAPGEQHVYVTDRGIDNNPPGNPRENDGRLYEFRLTV